MAPPQVDRHAVASAQRNHCCRRLRLDANLPAPRTTCIAVPCQKAALRLLDKHKPEFSMSLTELKPILKLPARLHFPGAPKRLGGVLPDANHMHKKLFAMCD